MRLFLLKFVVCNASVMYDTTHQSLINQGYRQLANIHGGSVDPDQLRPPPSASYVFFGCGPRDSIERTIAVGAKIPVTDFLKKRHNIQQGVVTTLSPSATGVYHYYQPGLSFGISGNPQVKLNQADTSDNGDRSRISIHMVGSTKNLYQCGTENTSNSNIVVYHDGLDFVPCTNFGPCSVTCGGGQKTCDNTCVGASWGTQSCPSDRKTETESCNTQQCEYFTPCSNFGECSVLCGGGEKTCQNDCIGGSWGLNGCPKDKEFEKESCNPEPCKRADEICPNAKCWKVENDDTCTLNEDDCTGLLVTCSTDGMDLVFPRELFDSDGQTVFKTSSDDAGCSPTDNGSTVNWNTGLGECGMTMSKTETNIIFSHTVAVTSTRTSTQVLQENKASVKVFTDDGILTSVTFSCVFPLTAEVTSTELTIQRPDSISTTATGVGSWDEAFDLGFFNEDFSGPMDPLSTKIGDTIYVKATFKVNIANISLKWYLKYCDVSEASFQLRIIKDTCFSGLVSTAFIGDNTNDPSQDKIISNESKFKFVSFGLGENDFAVHTKQQLTCGIVFCTENDNSAECGLPSETCPSSGDDAPYNYTPYGI